MTPQCIAVRKYVRAVMTLDNPYPAPNIRWYPGISRGYLLANPCLITHPKDRCFFNLHLYRTAFKNNPRNILGLQSRQFQRRRLKPRFTAVELLF